MTTKEEMENRMVLLISKSRIRGGFSKMIHYILAQTIDSKDKIKNKTFQMNDKIFLNNLLSRPSYNESVNILIALKFIKRIFKGNYEIGETFEYFIESDYYDEFFREFK